MSIDVEYYHHNEATDGESLARPIEAYDAKEDGLRTYMRNIGKRALLNAADEVELAKQIEAGMYADHLLQTAEKNNEKLPEERRRELAVVAMEGFRAKNEFLEANLRLVVFFAKRYQDRGLDLDDLVQAGNIGLIRAVEKFDYTKGVKFSTYAPWWIHKAIKDGIADGRRTIRMPADQVAAINNVHRIKRDLSEILGREPSLEEIAEDADMDVYRVAELLSYKDSISLDVPIGDNGESYLGDILQDVDELPFEMVVEMNETWADFRDVLKTILSAREYDILRSSYELEGYQRETQEVIAARHGLSRGRIGQIIRTAKDKVLDYSDGSLRELITSK